MEKKLLKKIFKEYMKEIGFRSKGNICYKPVTDDYLIVVFLEHCSYKNAYRVVYGVIYEPDTVQFPAVPKTDWSRKFLFTMDSLDDLSQYHLEDLQSNYDLKLVNWFDYSERSPDEFIRAMDENVEKRLHKLYDREFVLNQYRNDWVSFRRIPYDTVKKICRLAGLDYDEVVNIRDSRVRKWP